jgi:uncharacterized membrane protein HdeD (DUF308 family)
MSSGGHYGQRSTRRAPATFNAKGLDKEVDVSNTPRRRRLDSPAKNWWALALRGLVILLLGIILLAVPGFVLGVLGLLFGLYALADGALPLVRALRSSDRGARRWLPLTEGAIGITAGLAALLWPLTATGLLYVIATWATLTGAFEILIAIVMRREIEQGRAMALGGALSMLFGGMLAVFLVTLPSTGLPTLARLGGVLALVVGLALVVFAFRQRDRRSARV